MANDKDSSNLEKKKGKKMEFFSVIREYDPY